MIKLLHTLRILILFAAIFGYSEAQALEDPPFSIELVAPSNAFYADHSQWVALHFQVGDSWYTYWKNPGESGVPITVDWRLPEGFSVTDLRWPAPQKELTEGGVIYKYTGEFWLLARITPKFDTSLPASITLSANIQSLFCSQDTCLPLQKSVSLVLPVKDSGQELAMNPKFEKALSLLPQERKDIRVFRGKGQIEFMIPGLKDSFSAYFYPDQQGVIQGTDTPRLVETEDGLHVYINEAEDFSQNKIEGTLLVEHKQGKLPLLVASQVEPGLTDTESVSYAILWALGFAFLGGLLLNFMPCVLPVISLKIFHFVKMAGQDRSKTLMHGIAFSLGVLLSFWILASLLLLLQSYGQAVGWGFQLQEPIFVALLSVVMLVFSLSLFGVFEFGTGMAAAAGQTEVNTKRENLLGSFFSGILATAVATPCTGPFLGSAIGFAVTLPPFFALLIFTVLGLGMAFPYLMISAFPGFVRFLPKPGNWMITFKEIVGFVMLATVVWLMWVFAGQTGMMPLFILIVGFFAFAVGCWIYGKWAAPFRKKSIRRIAYVATLACFLLGTYAVIASSRLESGPLLPKEEIAFADQSAEKKTPWEPYSEARLNQLREQGIPVLVDFTARWCLICQVNHVSLSNPDVERKIQEKGVVKMLADWTKHDAEITKALGKYGRNGVPLYLLFGKEEAPKILPQLLTPEIVLEHLNQI